jgi:hypothetical protein
MTILMIGAVITAVPLFIGTLVLGIYAIPRAEPVHLLYAWDVLLVTFLFFWMIGLVTELQRSDVLSLSRFLQLPVSVSSAFAVNYISSLVCLSLVVFAPIMFGFALALVYVKGPVMLPVLPLILAFLLMVTAVTYQFQGWLASMMSNPRRRRTVIVLTTTAFVLIFQLPNLLNVYGVWGQQRADRVRAQVERMNALIKESKELEHAFQRHEIDQQEYARRQRKLTDELRVDSADVIAREETARIGHIARVANTLIPFGWLPLGVMSAAEGNELPSFLGILGLAAIGVASLRRAYRTTIAIYQGQPTNRKAESSAPTVSPSSEAQGHRGSWLETRIPGLSEPVSAVALGGLRSLSRSPEAKMMLLTPFILIPVTGIMALKGGHNLPELVRPLLAVGGMIMILFGILQLAGNQFGFDRDGFRVFVLCSASRRDILLGKNFALAPIVVILASLVVTAIQIFCPMRWDHLLATIPQFVSMFLLFCILANALSIYAPLHIAAGSFKASEPRLAEVLLQVVMFALAFPLTQSFVLIPLGAEVLHRIAGGSARTPVALFLSIVECAAIIAIYRVSLVRLGEILQLREQTILERVTRRTS